MTEGVFVTFFLCFPNLMSRREDNTKALAKGAAERDANAPEDQTGTVTMLKL